MTLTSPLLESSLPLCQDGGEAVKSSNDLSECGSDATTKASFADSPQQAVPSPVRKDVVTWDIRAGFGYDWLVVALTGFVMTMLAVAKLIDVLGERLVGTMLLAALCLAVVFFIFTCIRSCFSGQPCRGGIVLSGMPLWRLAIYHILKLLLYWQVFYTTGLPYLITSALFQAGVTQQNSPPWLWALLFPIRFGAVKAPNSWSDLYALGGAFIAGTIPFYVSSILTECLMICCVLPADRRPKDTYSLTDGVMCMIYAMLGMVVMKGIWLSKWAGPLYEYVFDNFRLTDAFNSEESVIGFWVCMVSADFFFYVYHRTSHIMSWLWTAHSVHHSSEEYNLTLGPRESFVDWATPTVIFSSVPMALFFPNSQMIAAAQIRLAWQYWLHLIDWPETPTIELLFATPSLHRVHHAKNHDRLGRNFGAIFSVWDRLFGTFEPEYLDGKGREHLFYGVVPAPNSWDPVWVNIQHWYHMFGKQMQYDSWAAPFRHWTPPGGRCPKLGTRLNPREKYSARPLSSAWMSYAVVEGLLMVVVVSVVVNTPSFWDSTRLQLLLGLRPSTADNVFGTVVVAIALWSASCIAQLFTEESMSTLSAEALRQILLMFAIAASVGFPSWSNFLQSYFAAYVIVRAAAIFALWREVPQSADLPAAESKVHAAPEIL